MRRDLERWFVRRGVPQLIEGYSTEARMDLRATPYIVAWLIIGTSLFWGTRPDWPPALNVAGILGTLAFVILGYAGQRRLRGRPISSTLGTFDLVDILSLALLPGIAAGIIDGSVREFIVATLNALLGIGLIYVAVLFGLAEMGMWAIGRISEQLTSIVGLVARTLPLLLILVAFLLFAAEIWEVAGVLGVVELIAVIALLGFVAGLLVVTTARVELRRLEDRGWPDLAADAIETPAAQLVTPSADPDRPLPERLSWLQRLNVVSLMLVSQLLQSAFVALLVMAFLVAFGLLVVPEAVQDAWVGAPVRPVVAFDLLGEPRTISVELLNVAALLSGIVGLYFTGLAVSEPGHREEHFAHVVAEVGQVLAARAYYVTELPEEPSVTVPAPTTDPA